MYRPHEFMALLKKRGWNACMNYVTKEKVMVVRVFGYDEISRLASLLWSCRSFQGQPHLAFSCIITCDPEYLSKGIAQTRLTQAASISVLCPLVM